MYIKYEYMSRLYKVPYVVHIISCIVHVSIFRPYNKEKNYRCQVKK